MRFGDDQRSRRNARTLLTALAVMAILASVRPDTAVASEVEEVCGPRGGEVSSQKSTYCDAAHTADPASKDEDLLWKVWAGVASVCSYACVQSITGEPTAQLVCRRANIGAAATQAYVTRQFTSALTTLGQVSAQQMEADKLAREKAAKAAEEGAQETADEAAERQIDYAACGSAASAGAQALGHRQSSDAAADSRDSNLNQARKLGGEIAGIDPNDPGVAEPVTAPITAGGTVVQPRTQCAHLSDPQAAAQCARGMDPSLPSFVATPEFAQEFEKTSGTPWKDFLARDMRGTDAASGLGGLMGTAMTAPAADKLKDVVRQLDQALRRDGTQVLAAQYRGGRGAHRSAGSADDDFGLDQMMKGLMDQLLPEGGKPKAPGLAGELSFQKLQSRSPASLVEDRSISLFERVEYRYSLKRGALQPGEVVR